MVSGVFLGNAWHTPIAKMISVTTKDVNIRPQGVSQQKQIAMGLNTVTSVINTWWSSTKHFARSAKKFLPAIFVMKNTGISAISGILKKGSLEDCTTLVLGVETVSLTRTSLTTKNNLTYAQ